MVGIPAPNHEGIKPPNRRNVLYLPNDTHQVHQCLIQPFMAQVNEQSIRRGYCIAAEVEMDMLERKMK